MLAFSDDYLFSVLVHQRPYAWTTDEADQLLNDPMEAQRKDPDDPYVLGIHLDSVLDVSESEIREIHERLASDVYLVTRLIGGRLVQMAGSSDTT